MILLLEKAILWSPTPTSRGILNSAAFHKLLNGDQRHNTL